MKYIKQLDNDTRLDLSINNLNKGHQINFAFTASSVVLQKKEEQMVLQKKGEQMQKNKELLYTQSMKIMKILGEGNIQIRITSH